MDEYATPCIIVNISFLFKNDSVLLEMLSGIEEEGIPFITNIIEEDDCINLSWMAAESSILEVGIGVDSKGFLAVHYKRLDKQSPLFKINYNLENDKIRNLCVNAARLVKSTPFIL